MSFSGFQRRRTSGADDRQGRPSRADDTQGRSTRRGEFRIITPANDLETNYDMWEYSLDRQEGDTRPRRVIEFLSEKWCEYRAWAQNLCTDLSNEGSCAAVACTGRIISVGDHHFERASSARGEHHAEENLLLNSQRARRKMATITHGNGKREEVLRIDLEIDCIVICLEPCFAGRYRGHSCRDFFTPKGRLFQPRDAGYDTRVVGRFVPRGNQDVPIFCFELQNRDVPASPGIFPFWNRQSELTKQRKKTRSRSNGWGEVEWVVAVIELFGPGYEVGYSNQAQYTSISEEDYISMLRFLEGKQWTKKNGMIMPKSAERVPRGHALETTENRGVGPFTKFDELDERGPGRMLRQRDRLNSGLSDQQERTDELGEWLDQELAWKLGVPDPDAYWRRRRPEVRQGLEDELGTKRSITEWEQRDPERLHRATLKVLVELIEESEWRAGRRTEAITQNEEQIDYWNTPPPRNNSGPSYPERRATAPRIRYQADVDDDPGPSSRRISLVRRPRPETIEDDEIDERRFIRSGTSQGPRFHPRSRSRPNV